MIINGWGQEIRVGDFVYRGARLGNGSEFKAGLVQEIKDGKPVVNWMYKSNGRWISIKGERVLVPYIYRDKSPGLGRPSVESLVVPEFSIHIVEHMAKVHENFPKDVDFGSMDEYHKFLMSPM